MRVLFIIIGLLGLAACSQKSAKVKLELTSSFAYNGSAAMQGVSEGGLMVWGKSTQGDHFARVLSNSDAIDLDIPNGSWTFTAVAWDSSDNTVFDRDAIRCARSATTDLKGDTAAVSLVLTTANCGSVNFQGTTSGVSSSLSVNLCQSTAEVTSQNDSCTNDPQSASRKHGKAPAMSVRVRLDEFDAFGGRVSSQGPGLSRCVPLPNNSLNGWWGTSPPDLSIPVGDPANPASAPYRTTFELYQASTDCGATGSTDLVPVTLPSGLGSPVGGHKYYGVSGTHHVYLNVPDGVICKGREGLSSFAGGDGSWAFPWLICSATQLYNIHLASTSKGDSFRLMTDVNLNPYTKGFAASAPSCWSEGQNWQPIGTDASCAPLANGFEGSFFGGGHTITGMRQRLNTQRVGFVGKWAPPGSPYHHITDLVFVDPEVEGTSHVGAVVGDKSNSFSSLIGNIEVRGGEIHGRQVSTYSNVGGVIGYADRTQLINLKTSRVNIQGEGLYIGGIFGQSINSEVLHKLVSRSYVGGPEWSQASKVGGIGGYVTSNVLYANKFGEWASESIVVGEQFVGGLLGAWGNTYHTVATTHRPLENVYAAGSITIRGENADHLGGLFGTSYAAAVLDKAYFAGSLLNDAKDPTCGGGGCNVGWLIGQAQGLAHTSTYVMTESSGGHDSLLVRSSYGDDPDGPSGNAPLAPTQVSPSSIFSVGVLSPLTSGPWVHVSGDKPRLVFEKHPCSADADANGVSPRSALALQNDYWGTAAKPMMICRLDQFSEIGTELTAGKIGVIVGALNLGSASPHVKPSIVSGAYLTGEGGYIHGLRRTESPGSSFSWAPFQNINGALENLIIAGVDLRAPIAVASSSISGLAVLNSGSVKNVKLVTGVLYHDDQDISINGLVGSNMGVMKEVGFEGTLAVGSGAPSGVNVAGLAQSNSGIIQDSEAAGRILLADGGNNIGGVARTNSGSIKRVSVASKLTSMGNTVAVNNLGMVAITNSGTILDVHVTGEADWRAWLSSNVAQIAVTQVGGASVLKRVIVDGFLYDTQNSTSFVNGNLNFVKTVAGTMTSLVVVPAGRLIAEASPTDISSCSAGTPNLVMSTNFTMPSAFNSTGYWDSTSMPAASKIVWAVFDNGDGYVRYAHVLNWTEQTSDAVTLSQDCSALGFSGTTRIRFVQDYEGTLASAIGDVTTSPYVGFYESGSRFSASYLTGPDWNENIAGAPVSNTVVARESSGTDWILDIFAEYLDTGTITTPKPIWEVESGDEKIELFRIKK